MSLTQPFQQPQIEEGLSEAYIAAVAAKAQCTLSTPRRDLFGIDFTIYGAVPGGTPQINVQLKATVNLNTLKTGERSFGNLPVRTYDILRNDDLVPQLLVVLDLPKDPDDWLHISVNELILRRCAYWVCLRGKPPAENKNTISVRFPKENVFNADSLRDLMNRANQSPDLR